MSRIDESLIRDDDLRQKLEQARGTVTFAVMVKHLTHEQGKRDKEAVEMAEKAEALAAMPRDTRRRAIIREVIETEGPSPEHLRFMPTPLAICGLPYRRLPEGVTEFERKQGRMAVVVAAGKLRAPDGRRIGQPVPWGPKARLIMAHLSTEAIRNKSPIVETADTLSAFMREMGFEVTGGRHGTIGLFKEQLQALAACRMELSAWDGKRSAMVEVKPLQKVELWFSDNPDQQSLWPNIVHFSDEFFDQLQKHALPVDIRALRAFSNSARKLDLLFWLIYRMTRIDQKLVLDWKPLKEQFGEGFGRERDFRAQLAADLASVLELFPKLPIKLTERGLELHDVEPSAFALPRRSPTAKR